MNRTLAPTITQTKDLTLTLPIPERYTLDNGIPVCVINAGSQDVLLLDFNFTAGNAYETKNLVSAAVSHLLKSGTTTKTAFELNEAVEYYGAYLNRGTGAEFANITLHTMARHLEALLPIVYDVIYNSTMPADELVLFKKQRQQQLVMNLQKGDVVANRQIDEYLYGAAHPYGRNSSVEAYEAITQDDCINFYKQYYQNAPYTIYVGGKVPTNIISLLNDTFSKQNIANTVVLPNYVYAPHTQKVHHITNDATAVQGAIRIARPFFNRHHPHFKECMVLNNIFGGYFGSRLMSNIREDKGYTYGIYSYIQNHIEQSAWLISTEAGKDVTPATLTEIYKEMELLKNELVDEEELQLVQNYMIGQLLGDLDGPFQLVNRWKIYDNNKVGGSYFYDYIQTIRSITPQRIQALANEYFKKEDFYEVVVY